MIRNMANFKPLVVCTMLCLAACGGDSGGDAAKTGSQLHHKARNSKAAASGPTREEQTAGMVSAASPVRSAEIAELKFDIPTRPEAGKPVGVDLALLPMTDCPSVTLDLSGSEGLTVPAEDASASFSDASRLHVYRKSVVVTPASEGMYFLSVVATFRNPDSADTRSFTVPLIVGPARAAPANAAPAQGATAKKNTHH